MTFKPILAAAVLCCAGALPASAMPIDNLGVKANA